MWSPQVGEGRERKEEEDKFEWKFSVAEVWRKFSWGRAPEPFIRELSTVFSGGGFE